MTACLVIAVGLVASSGAEPDGDEPAVLTSAGAAIDTLLRPPESAPATKEKKAKKREEARIVEEVAESDHEMEAPALEAANPLVSVMP